MKKQRKRNKRRQTYQTIIGTSICFSSLWLFSFGMAIRPEASPKVQTTVNQEYLNYEQEEKETKEVELETVEKNLVGLTYPQMFEEEEEELIEEIIENVLPQQTVYSLPYREEYQGFKAYMEYSRITSVTSKQYHLQNYAYTDIKGLRMVNERYCVAMGTYFNLSIGQYFDLILENGTVIPCVLADVKANTDTDINNVYSIEANYCCSEFVVDESALDSKIKIMGNVSYAYDNWNSPVMQVIVYEERVELE